MAELVDAHGSGPCGATHESSSLSPSTIFPLLENPRRMLVTDLDGTLTRPDGTIGARNLEALRALGQAGVPRVVATGRSAFGARRVLPADFPIDYLVFSSGAGVIDWRTGELLVCHHMRAEDIASIGRALLGMNVDFMVHKPIPGNHEFVYWETGRENPDFKRRRERHAAYCRPWDGKTAIAEASQFIVVDPTPRSSALYERVRASLAAFNVFRATSPLDGLSAWIEIFPPSVSKALACEWVAARLGVAREKVLAVGNDYNDIDLLDWAGMPFVVANAPDELRAAYPSVAASADDGVAEAIARWRSYSGT